MVLNVSLDFYIVSEHFVFVQFPLDKLTVWIFRCIYESFGISCSSFSIWQCVIIWEGLHCSNSWCRTRTWYVLCTRPVDLESPKPAQNWNLQFYFPSLCTHKFFFFSDGGLSVWPVRPGIQTELVVIFTTARKSKPTTWQRRRNIACIFQPHPHPSFTSP